MLCPSYADVANETSRRRKRPAAMAAVVRNRATAGTPPPSASAGTTKPIVRKSPTIPRMRCLDKNRRGDLETNTANES